jgi:hypothetical protein
MDGNADPPPPLGDVLLPPQPGNAVPITANDAAWHARTQNFRRSMILSCQMRRWTSAGRCNRRAREIRPEETRFIARVSPEPDTLQSRRRDRP